MRSARASGCRRMASIAAAVPTATPACGPPSSLSPLKVTTSAPAARLSRTAGSSANSGKSASAPLPRSSISRPPRSWASVASCSGRRLGREPDDAVVARVHAQDRTRALAPGALEVAQVGAVRGADLVQLGAALGQDVGDAEPVADLDQLATRDQHVAVAGGGRQRQQDGGRVVVDHQGVLGPGQRAEDVAHVVLARGALAQRQAVLEVAVRARRLHHGADGLVAAATSAPGWCERPRRRR